MSPLKLRPEKETAPLRPKDVRHPTQCTSCRQLFTIVVRKHHCVSCHDVFCGKCSKIRAHSEQGELVRQRFCVLCEKEHAERNTIRNGMRIRQRASILQVTSPDRTLSFSEIKKLMKAPPLPGPVNDHPLTPISASFGRPPAGGGLRRRSTKSLMNETISSCNTDRSEPLTPDVSFIETECSVITGDSSFLGTVSSSRDMSSQLELELLDLSDIEQCDELQNTPIEPYSVCDSADPASTPVYNDLNEPSQATQSEQRDGQTQLSPEVTKEMRGVRRERRDRRERRERSNSECDSSVGVFTTVALIAAAIVALLIVHQVVWYGFVMSGTLVQSTARGTMFSTGTPEASSLANKWSRAVGSTLHPIGASVYKALALYDSSSAHAYHTYHTQTMPAAEPAAVFNIVVHVEKRNIFQSFSGLMKKVVDSAVGPLAEGLRDVDEIYI